MNPYSPELKYAKKMVEHALERCRIEQENTGFLIQVKETLIEISERGRKALRDEIFDAPFVLVDGEIIIPSPRSILEHEELHHVNTLTLQKALLEEIKEAVDALDNALRKHKQNYDYKFQKFINRRRTSQSKNNSTTSSSNV